MWNLRKKLKETGHLEKNGKNLDIEVVYAEENRRERNNNTEWP